MHRFLFGTFELTNIPCQPCLARKACRTCGETLAGYFPACKCLLAAVVGGCSGRALDILENPFASICIFEVPLVPKLGAVHSHWEYRCWLVAYSILLHMFGVFENPLNCILHPARVASLSSSCSSASSSSSSLIEYFTTAFCKLQNAVCNS